MPEDKEWSAVAALLNEINSLRQRIDALEMYLWIWRTNTTRCWSYTNLTDTIPIRTARDVIPYRYNYEDDNIYAVTDDNITIPLTWIGWHYGTYCASSHS